jgi:hypothetical protein
VDKAHTVFLGISHLITLDGLNDTLGLLLERTKQSGGYFFVVDGIVGLFKEVIDYRGG